MLAHFISLLIKSVRMRVHALENNHVAILLVSSLSLTPSAPTSYLNFMLLCRAAAYAAWERFSIAGQAAACGCELEAKINLMDSDGCPGIGVKNAFARSFD